MLLVVASGICGFHTLYIGYMSWFKSEGNKQSAEVTGLSVSVGLDSLVLVVIGPQLDQRKTAKAS